MAWYDDLNKRATIDAQSGANHNWDQFAQIQAMPQSQITTTKKGGNLLTGLIPTAGGTAGALGGAALGASVGSIVPGIGTAIGGLLGALLGGAGGSALGKVGENAIEGESDLGQGVGEEALFGGLTSLPITAGLKLAKAGVKTATGVGKTAAKDLVEQAGAATVGKGTAAKYGLGVKIDAPVTDSLGNVINPSAAQRVGGAMENYGTERALANQVNLTRADVRRIGDFDPIDTLNHFGKNYGTTDLNEINKLGSFATGAGGKEDGSAILTNIIENTARSGRGVSIDKLNDVVAPYRALMTPADSKKLDDYIKKVTDLTGFADTATGVKSANLADPMGALRASRELQKNGAFLKNAANPSPSNEALGTAYQALGRELKDRTYNAQAGIDTGIAGLTQDAQAALNDGVKSLKAEASRYRAAGNEKFASQLETLAGEIQGAKSLQELDQIATPFVHASQLSSLTARSHGGAGVKLGGLKETATGAINSALGVPMAAVDKALSSKVADAGRAIANDGTNLVSKTGGQGVAPLAIRQSVGRLLLPSGDQQTDPTTLAGALAAGSSLEADLPSTAQLDTQQSAQPNPTGYSSAEIAQALAKAYAAGDKASASALESMYSLASDWEKSQQSQLSATAAANLASNGNATNTLDQLEQLFTQAGGGGGRIGGSIANLLAGAGLNNNAQTYNDLAASSVSQLAKALNGSGQVSDADARVIAKALPSITDSPEVAQAKFNALRARLVQAQQNTLTFNGGGSDLENVLAGL